MSNAHRLSLNQYFLLTLKKTVNTSFKTLQTIVFSQQIPASKKIPLLKN